jgi:hypothetical protein
VKHKDLKNKDVKQGVKNKDVKQRCETRCETRHEKRKPDEATPETV